MSLRAFHIVFIVASAMLAALGGFWTIAENKPVGFSIASFACSACLALYLIWFVKKSKNLRP